MVKKWGMWIFVMIMLLVSVTACAKSIEQQIQEQLELGEKYLAELDYDNAIVAFTKAIELEPKTKAAYQQLAKAYEGKGDFEKAAGALEAGYVYFQEEDMTAALVRIYQEYAKSCTEQGDVGKALEILKRGYEMTGDDSLLELQNQLKEASEKTEVQEKVGEYEMQLRTLAEAITQEDIYEYDESLILSEDFRKLTQDLQETVIFDMEEGIYLAVYPGGYVYYGEMKDGRREGNGVWYWGDEAEIMIASGAWAGDLPNGSMQIRELINMADKEREEGRTYAVWTQTSCNVTDGIYDGSAQIVWNMDNGDVHEWEAVYAQGLLQPIYEDVAAVCKNTEASLIVGEYVYMVKGVK